MKSTSADRDQLPCRWCVGTGVDHTDGWDGTCGNCQGSGVVEASPRSKRLRWAPLAFVALAFVVSVIARCAS